MIGCTHCIVLTIVNTVTQPVENWNLKLRIFHSVKFHACGPIPRECASRMTLKTSKHICDDDGLTTGVMCFDFLDESKCQRYLAHSFGFKARTYIFFCIIFVSINKRIFFRFLHEPCTVERKLCSGAKLTAWLIHSSLWQSLEAAPRYFDKISIFS
jgi:hypothetical protein